MRTNCRYKQLLEKKYTNIKLVKYIKRGGEADLS